MKEAFGRAMGRQRVGMVREVWTQHLWRGARLALPLLLFVLLTGSPVLAQGGENQAGLVIVQSDGRVVTRCVSFSDPQISGLALLERSGLAFSSDAGPVGARVCSINGDGCPASDCWCQCKGVPCAYWNYYARNPDGSWAYAGIGAAMRQLGNGDVDGWVWGDGSILPPVMSFEAICSAAPASTIPPAASATATITPEAVASTPTRLPTATQSSATATAVPQVAEATARPSPTPMATDTPTATALPLVAATEQPTSTSIPPTPTASVTPTPAGSSPSEGNRPPAYVAFAVILALIGGAFLLQRRLRHEGRQER